MIESYDFGHIVIDGKEYTSDVILDKGSVSEWWRKTSHNVEPADIEQVATKKPELIIFGNGFSGNMAVPDETVKWLEEKGIKIVVQITKDAVATYNSSKVENKIGCFHLTC
ncbi:MAG: Mth938-like domain-containing protein [Candidatus Nanoarchaeia archaeon]